MATRAETKIIGLKKFRACITSLWKEAKKKNTSYIVFHRSTPILKVQPISKHEHVIEKLAQEVREARVDAKAGKMYSEEEVYKKLGL